MAALSLKLFVSYLLGSVIGSLVVGTLRGGVDIRTQGSGNAGGTNALRTQGAAFAFWVMVIDVGKAVLATTVVAHATVPGLDGPAWSGSALALACGAAAVVGHVWPAFYQFRGGKGAATLLGTLAVASPWALVPMLSVFAASLVTTGYVGLSTVLATATLPLFALWQDPAGIDGALFAFGVAMTAFIAYTHRSNLARLRAGTENRFEKAMLFRRRRA
jgi:glycerol-3-phosphate acyltransferase PlsY